MEIAARLDDYGRTGWIVVSVLGFIIFWPVGLLILGYAIWSGRMGCWTKRDPGRWHNQRAAGRNGRTGSGYWCGGRRASASSGNVAFDEYREETLRRLEDEQKEFGNFLDRLREAKDRAEFEQFMDERRRPSARGDDDDGDPGDVPPRTPEAPNGFAPQPQA